MYISTNIMFLIKVAIATFKKTEPAEPTEQLTMKRH